MAIRLTCTKGENAMVNILWKNIIVDIESVIKLDIASFVTLPFDAEEMATQELNCCLAFLAVILSSSWTLE